MKNRYIAFCGYNVFPSGFAQTQRLLLIAKGLEELNCRTIVLCRYGTYDSASNHISSKGISEGVHYQYCSGSSYRSKSFLKRNLRKLFGIINELTILFKLRINRKLDCIFISTNSFHNSFFYLSIARLLFVSTVIDTTEFWSAPSRGKKSTIDAKLHDYLSPRLFNKVICISDFLVNHTSNIKGNKNIIKIPVLVDFSKFENISSNRPTNEQTVLFCGSAAYYPIIDFIISAFELTDIDSAKLIIVASSGNESDYFKINTRIQKSSKCAKIILKSNLQYMELTELYLNSFALLIPLRPNIQDIARFPHKLGEYTASKSIIITTKFGEIPNYFEDMKNALVANDFEPSLFAKKIELAINNYDKLENLREASYRTGIESFDYKLNGVRIYNFLFPSEKQ
jgi:glycosyltransferase involved in cell wall biosynthesis